MKTTKERRKKFAENFLQKYFSLLLTVLVVFFWMPQSVFATPAIPVDRDQFSIGNAVTAEFMVYGVKSQHTGYKEDNANGKIFYTRTGTADPGQPLRFLLSAMQSLPGAVQEMELTVQPFDVVNRYAGKKMETFYRKAKGSPGKQLNVNIEYKIPPKARLLVVTAQLKDFYKEGNKTLPRYTTVEYELRVVGYAEANATPFSGKSVKKVNDNKGKRIIIEDKHSDAIVGAIGIGGSFVAAFIYWLFHRGKKKTGAGSAQQQEQLQQDMMYPQQQEQRKQNEINPQQEEQNNQSLQEQEAKQPVDAAGTIGAASSVPNLISNQTAVTEQPHFCSNCGAKLKPGSRFCENCGTKV